MTSSPTSRLSPDLDPIGVLRRANAELTELVDELRDYFDNRADADQPSGEAAQPNEEMKMLMRIDDVLASTRAARA